MTPYRCDITYVQPAQVAFCPTKFVYFCLIAVPYFIYFDIYQVRLPEYLVLVSPSLEANCDGFAATNGRTVWSSPDFDDWNFSGDLEVLADDVTDLGLRHGWMLLHAGVRFDAVEHLSIQNVLNKS